MSFLVLLNWVLLHFEFLSFLTFRVFELSYCDFFLILSHFEFCYILSFWVVIFWDFKICHILSFVLSHLQIMSCYIMIFFLVKKVFFWRKKKKVFCFCFGKQEFLWFFLLIEKRLSVSTVTTVTVTNVTTVTTIPWVGR